MLKPVNTNLSRHTTITGHISCRSCSQYTNPTSTPPVHTLFSPHSVNQPHLNTTNSHSVLSSLSTPILPQHHQFTLCSLPTQYTNPPLAPPVHTLFSPHSVHQPHLNTTSSHSVLSSLSTPIPPQHHQFTLCSLLTQYTNPPLTPPVHTLFSPTQYTDPPLTPPVHTLFSPHSVHQPSLNTTSSHSVLSPLSTPTLP
jgi:hypothetical protein